MIKQKNAFTLVELIVVITILAILGTIAFISLQWYSKDARDSIRISDTSNMETSLELFHLDAGKYPLPDNNEVVDYWTETLWYQWDFWNSVISSLSRSMTEIPTDPLTDKKYVFSVANNKNEFEILSLLEWDSLALNTINQTNAASLEVTPKIDWTYNRVFIKTANYIVPVPSIVTSEIVTWTMTLDSSNIKSQVVNWWENIPEQWNVVSNTWALSWLVLSVYTWSININTSNSEKEIVIGKIKDAYTGSVLASSDIYEYILSTSGTEEIVWVLNTIVLNDDTTEVSVVANTCDDTTKPADDLNKTYTVNPTSVDQAYVQDDAECWYACTWGYTWVNCQNAPDPFANCIWVNNPAIWNWSIATTITYGSCDTADIVICNWNGVWYTLASCNVWTNIAWTTTSSYWWLFQWWNNFDFRWWQFVDGDSYPTTSNSQVSISATWSIYSDSTYIYGFSDWNSPTNNDLWWDITDTDSARKWPCEVWYHVPTHTEWAWIITAWWWGTNWTNLKNDLNLPMAGARGWSTNLDYQDGISYGLYFSSSQFGTEVYRILFTPASINPNDNTDRSTGLSVRCLRN
jgi:prepilin-type N-terminal cleavage/methylation domain-containing protein